MLFTFQGCNSTTLAFVHLHFAMLPVTILEPERLRDNVEWSSIHNGFGNAQGNTMSMKELRVKEFNFSLKETKLICILTLYLSTCVSTAVWDPCVFKY